jgi:hypothetical protein
MVIAQVEGRVLNTLSITLVKHLNTNTTVLGYQKKTCSFEPVISGGAGPGRSRSSFSLGFARIHIRLPESFLAWQRRDQILQAPKLRPARETEGIVLEGRIR